VSIQQKVFNKTAQTLRLDTFLRRVSAPQRGTANFRLNHHHIRRQMLLVSFSRMPLCRGSYISYCIVYHQGDRSGPRCCPGQKICTNSVFVPWPIGGCSKRCWWENLHFWILSIRRAWPWKRYRHVVCRTKTRFPRRFFRCFRKDAQGT